MNSTVWLSFAIVVPILYVIVPWIVGACIRAKACKAEPHLAHPPPSMTLKVVMVIVLIPVIVLLAGVVVDVAMIILGAVILFVLTLIRLIFTANGGLRRALSHITQNLGAAKFAEQMRDAPPSLYVNVRCWHRERRRSGSTTTYVTVVTFEVNIPIQISSWYDDTPALYVPSTSKSSMYSIETSHLIEFSDPASPLMLQTMLNHAYATNCWRDCNCSVNYRTSIPGLVEKIIISDTGKIPPSLSKCTYILCRIIGQELPYYYNLGAKLGVIKYCVVKKVSIVPANAVALVQDSADPSQMVLTSDAQQAIDQHIINCSGGSQNVPAVPKIPEYQSPSPVCVNTAPLVSSNAQEAQLEQGSAYQQLILQQANQYSREGGTDVREPHDGLRPLPLSVDSKPVRVSARERQVDGDIPPLVQLPAPSPIFIDDEFESVDKVVEQPIDVTAIDTVPTPLTAGPTE